MKINKQKLKYRIIATVVTLSVLLSYVAVFVTESYAAESDTSSGYHLGWSCPNRTIGNVTGTSYVYLNASSDDFIIIKDGSRYYACTRKECSSYEQLADKTYNGGFRGGYISEIGNGLVPGNYYYVFNDGAIDTAKWREGKDIDYSLAINYDKVQESQREYDYDETYPYYDKASIAVNANSTATYNANMSQDMTNRYYELNAKIADKTGNSDDKHTRAYVEYYAAAIYADSSKLGVFNNYVLQYGNSVGSLSGTLPNGKKMDEIVKFDSNGRLCVSGYSGVEERGYKLICKEDTSSYLIAVEIDKITANDQVLCSPSFQRQLDADLKFTNSGSADGFLFGGTNSDSYTLIGYCTDIRINIVQGNKYTYSKDTYTYTWLNSAMRDRYGTKSTTYDNNSISTGENYEFDNNGNGYGGFEISDQTNMDSMKDYARTGFGLLGKDGYLALTAAALYQVPFFIWQCIGFVICVYGTFVLMKLLVKFL